MSLRIKQCEIPEVLEFESDLFHDDRGYFTEFHNNVAALQLGFTRTFVQDNLSRSSRGVLRGLHYQLSPQAQGKLVRCVTGAIFDVGVDIREGSPSFGKHVARELTAEKGNSLWIPEGFAHGFLCLTDNTHVMYKFTSPWVSHAEAAIRYDDPSLAIPWPFEPTSVNAKDLDAPSLSNARSNFEFDPIHGIEVNKRDLNATNLTLAHDHISLDRISVSLH